MSTRTALRPATCGSSSGPGERVDREATAPARQPIAAVMFPLKALELQRVQQWLGDSWLVTGAYSQEEPDLVLVRPCSAQTVVGLRRRFPRSRLIAVEADGSGLGPVGRMLGQGVHRYVLSVEMHDSPWPSTADGDLATFG